MSDFDTVILWVCAALTVILVSVLIWWLVCGKQRFIERRCRKSEQQEISSEKQDI